MNKLYKNLRNYHVCFFCVFLIYLLSGCLYIGTDYNAGTRSYDVGYSGDAQWLADVNGDGSCDFIYNKENSHDYHILVANSTNGKFETDIFAGSRDSNNNVGSGNAQWLADVNGDGKADYVYNRDKKDEYWVMLGKSDGTFETDKLAGSRNSNNNVGYSGKAQWMADVNGDGRADYVYNRNSTHEYWIMLANSDATFKTDKKAGTINRKNNVGFSGNAQWLADVNGDGRFDFIYNRGSTPDYWVMLGKIDGTLGRRINKD